MLRTRIAVMASGGGTNLQALLDSEKDGRLKSGVISLVIASKSEAYAIKRAEAHGVDWAVVSKKELGSQESFEAKLFEVLEKHHIEMIILAGYLTIFSGDFTSRYPDRIINVHPSLIPSFCGKGYYGLRVHEAALEYGVKVTGATVHYVNEVTDGGKIILQKAIEINKNDTPETLQRRVMEKCEWKLLPRAAELVAKDIAKKRK